MDEVENLLSELLRKITKMSSTLEEISGKLDKLCGTNSLDDFVSRIDKTVTNAVDKIVGNGPCYNLPDIHTALTIIANKLSNIR